MTQKKTKIVCTIGPSSWDPKVLEQLAVAGMDCARLNMSHGSYEEKQAQIDHVRRIAKKLNKPISVMIDLQGPKIRLGKITIDVAEAIAKKIDSELLTEHKDPRIILTKGQVINLSVLPDSGDIPMQYDLSPFIKKDHRILLNDGLIEVKVQRVSGKMITALVQNDGWISSNKGVNVPDTLLPGASLTPKDYADAEFGLKAGGDYLAISFVQTPDDIAKARELIKKYKSHAKVIVKLEKPQAVERLEEIIIATDVIMVARGDLAIETSAASVPLVQKRIMTLARQYFKPVIVATQMLESMTENPRPTRAEVSDVANAVFDQADAVMLSGESANGKYPVEAVKTMADIIDSVEGHEEYENIYGVDWEVIEAQELSNRAIASTAAILAEMANAKDLIVGTATGKTAVSVSIFRPSATIWAMTHDEKTYNQLALVWGVNANILEPADSADQFWKNALNLLKKNKMAKTGEKVVIVTGPKIGVSGQTNNIKLLTV